MSTKLSSLRKKIEVKLPKTKGTVWLWDELLTGDIRASISNSSIGVDGSMPTQNTFDILLKLIADWDFVDDDDKKLKINFNNLDKLPIDDFNMLAEKVAEVTKSSTVSENIKKNTKKTST